MPDGSDARYHTTTGRGSASLNLLGGLPDPPPEPADTSSFTFRVNNVCVYCGVSHLAMVKRVIYKNNVCVLWCVCVFALWNALIIIGTQNLIHETNKLKSKHLINVKQSPT